MNTNVRAKFYCSLFYLVWSSKASINQKNDGKGGGSEWVVGRNIRYKTVVDIEEGLCTFFHLKIPRICWLTDTFHLHRMERGGDTVNGYIYYIQYNIGT